MSCRLLLVLHSYLTICLRHVSNYFAQSWSDLCSRSSYACHRTLLSILTTSRQSTQILISAISRHSEVAMLIPKSCSEPPWNIDSLGKGDALQQQKQQRSRQPSCPERARTRGGRMIFHTLHSSLSESLLRSTNQLDLAFLEQVGSSTQLTYCHITCLSIVSSFAVSHAGLLSTMLRA